MTTSASATASPVGSPLGPASSALLQLFEPSRSPTRTSCPESRRFCECACPWLPNPSTAILCPDSAEGSVSLSWEIVVIGGKPPLGGVLAAPEERRQPLELVRLAGRLQGERAPRHVDDVGAEHRGDLHHARAILAVRSNLHEHQLALDGLARLVLEDLDHVDQLVQLLRDLLERLAVHLNDDRHPREPVVARRTHRERGDVEPSRRDQPGPAREHAPLVP